MITGKLHRFTNFVILTAEIMNESTTTKFRFKDPNTSMSIEVGVCDDAPELDMAEACLYFKAGNHDKLILTKEFDTEDLAFSFFNRTVRTLKAAELQTSDSKTLSVRTSYKSEDGRINIVEIGDPSVLHVRLSRHYDTIALKLLDWNVDKLKHVYTYNSVGMRIICNSFGDFDFSTSQIMINYGDDKCPDKCISVPPVGVESAFESLVESLKDYIQYVENSYYISPSYSASEQPENHYQFTLFPAQFTATDE